MKQPDYTPLPWHVDRTWGSEMIVAADGGVMFNDDSNDTVEGVAEYIVHCVNTHNDLLAACETALAIAEDRQGGTWDDVMIMMRAALAAVKEAQG